MNLAAAVLAATLTLGPAGHTPPPPSTVTTHGGQCLTATGTAAFDPVVLSQCTPGAADQQWAFGRTGRIRLEDTSLYLNAGSDAAYLSAWRQAPTWVYVNLRLAADGQWLTWCSSAGTEQPWLQGKWAPGCQNWRVVTPGG